MLTEADAPSVDVVTPAADFTISTLTFYSGFLFNFILSRACGMAIQAHIGMRLYQVCRDTRSVDGSTILL